MNRVKVYDAEVFRNYISFTFIDFEDYLNVRETMGDLTISKDKRYPLHKDILLFSTIPVTTFEISAVEGYNVNDLGGLLSYTSQNDYLSGFNNNGYDNLILNYLCMNVHRYRDIKKLIEKAYEFSVYIIDTPNEIARKDEQINLVRKYNGNYYTIDLQKIAALDKIYKSLKQTLINLKWYNILEYKMPPISELDRHYYDPRYSQNIKQWDRYMIKEYIKDLVDYNISDVLGTCELFYFLLDDIKLRFEINEEYGINTLSASNSKIGDIFFRKFYTEAANISATEFAKLRTYRKAIKLENCIHKSVKFKTLPFKKMLADVKSRVVYSTTELNIDFINDNVTYNIRSGGLHSVDYPDMFKSTKDTYVRDADVGSFYPYLILNGKVKPKHLDDIFFKVFQRIVDDRMEAKLNDYKVKAAVLKITANGVYGKFNFEYGPLFDTKCTLQVTITGQLQLLMLVERLTMNNFKVISANTDGIVTIIPKERDKEYHRICEEWIKDVNLNLEFTDYALYIRRDVNNYFTVKDISDPYESIKAKGDLDEYLRIAEPKLNKGFDMPIIAKAIQRYFIENIPIIETLKSHRDIYDFCTTKNIGSDFHLELNKLIDGEVVVEKLQKSTRFYISTNGGTLLKVKNFGGSVSNMSKGNKVTIFNRYKHNENFANYHIDYTYYHRACNKIMNHIKTSVRPGAKSKKRIRERLDQGTLF